MNDWYKKQLCHVTFLEEVGGGNQIYHRRGYSIHYKTYVCIIMIYNKWKIKPEIILNPSKTKL